MPYYSFCIRRCTVCTILGLFLMMGTLHAADAAWNYAVQLSAEVTSSPAEVRLSWPEDTWATASYKPSYAVRRKDPGASAWGAAVSLGAGVTSYVDRGVQSGKAYEYEVARTFQNPAEPTRDHVGYGYIRVGIDAAFQDHGSRVLLVIEDRVATGLADKVARLRDDLLAEGWLVTSLTVGAGDSPVSVRQKIAAAYNAASPRPQALYLLGRIPVAKSGSTWTQYAGLGPPYAGPEDLIPRSPDGHEPRALPSDAFYADVDGVWTDANNDGIYENDAIPSDVEMGVGRVDFSDLPALRPLGDDLALTGRYLDKTHAFRRGELNFERRALIGDRVGLDWGRAPAASGYRNFAAFYGSDKLLRANTEDSATDAERWITRIRNESYGWAFGSGGGAPNAIASLGLDGAYKSLFNDDIASGTRVGFYFLFGSNFVDWAVTDNLLRSALASNTGGLGAAWSGRPGFILHGLGLGDVVSNGVRATQNNNAVAYLSARNAFQRAIHISWIGDPTLRLFNPRPPASVSGTRSGAAVTVNWQPPGGSGSGTRYLVYRASSADGPFTRLTATPVDGTRYTDSASPGGSTYLVRAVMTERTGSGSYENASGGVRWTSPAGGGDPGPGDSDARLVNLSSRLRLSGGDPAITGLVISGTTSKQVLIRAVGPSLSKLGVRSPVPDPTLELFNAAGGSVAKNSGWSNDSRIANAAASVGAFAFTAGSRDAALLVTLAPGAYTAHVRSPNQGTVLLEMYEVAANAASKPLVNLSTRGTVGTGDDIMVAGLTLSGTEPMKVLIRGVGPGLVVHGVSGVLGNPVLTLHDGASRVIARNDDWGSPQGGASVPISGSAAEVSAASSKVGAFALDNGSRDAAMVVTLNPGSYTAIVSGSGGSTGNAMVEVYEVR